MTLDSNSMGYEASFLEFADLARGLESLPSAPTDGGRVRLIVRKSLGGSREPLHRVRLSVALGIPGDAWSRREHPSVEAQIAVMQADVAELIANGQRLALSGDNLFLGLDLSSANLPAGSVVRAGGATLTVTPKPHNGCQKYRARFGPGAIQFVSHPALRHRNLRGIYMRVLEDGEVAVGDPVTVIRRATVEDKTA